MQTVQSPRSLLFSLALIAGGWVGSPGRVRPSRRRGAHGLLRRKPCGRPAAPHRVSGRGQRPGGRLCAARPAPPLASRSERGLRTTHIVRLGNRCGDAQRPPVVPSHRPPAVESLPLRRGRPPALRLGSARYFAVAHPRTGPHRLGSHDSPGGRSPIRAIGSGGPGRVSGLYDGVQRRPQCGGRGR